MGLAGIIEPKKHPARDKNCMIELRELKKQVDNEIRREQKEGKLELTKPNDSTVVKSSSQGKSQPRKVLNAKSTSATATTNALNYTSLRRKQDPENLLDPFNADDGAFKAKGSYSSTNVNTSKIQKFIEK